MIKFVEYNKGNIKMTELIINIKGLKLPLKCIQVCLFTLIISSTDWWKDTHQSTFEYKIILCIFLKSLMTIQHFNMILIRIPESLKQILSQKGYIPNIFKCVLNGLKLSNLSILRYAFLLTRIWHWKKYYSPVKYLLGKRYRVKICFYSWSTSSF